MCFTMQAVLMALVPDIPSDVTIQMKRNEFIVSKVIDKDPDMTRHEIEEDDIQIENLDDTHSVLSKNSVNSFQTLTIHDNYDLLVKGGLMLSHKVEHHGSFSDHSHSHNLDLEDNNKTKIIGLKDNNKTVILGAGFS